MKLFAVIGALILLTIAAVTQQSADPEFNTSVENPAYKKDGPRVMFDEAHHNFHTTDGRYKPFVDLIVNDGYRVLRKRQSFGKITLSSYKILVIDKGTWSGS